MKENLLKDRIRQSTDPTLVSYFLGLLLYRKNAFPSLLAALTSGTCRMNCQFLPPSRQLRRSGKLHRRSKLRTLRLTVEPTFSCLSSSPDNQRGKPTLQKMTNSSKKKVSVEGGYTKLKCCREFRRSTCFNFEQSSMIRDWREVMPEILRSPLLFLTERRSVSEGRSLISIKL